MKLRAVVLLLVSALSVRAAERLTLAEAARRAVARSPTLRAAEAQVDEARRAGSAVRATNYPSLHAGSAFTRGDGPVYAFASLLDQRNFTAANFDIGTLNDPGYVTNFKSYLQVGLPIFAGYDIQNGSRMADLGLSQAESGEAGARQEVRLAVFEAAMQWIQARALSDRLTERLRASGEEIQSAERLRAKGLVLGSDFFAAEAVLAGLEAWKAQTAKMAEAGRDSLAVLLGQDPSEFDIVGTLSAQGPALPSATELQRLAGTHRADVRAADLAAQRGALAVSQEKAAFLPRVDAMAKAETNTEDFSSNPSNRLVMVRAEWALGDPAYGARKETALAASRAGDQRRAALEERVRLEILQSLRRYEGISDALPSLERTVDLAEKSLNLFRPLYREGRQSILDVLRAEESLARAESLRLEALAQLHLQRARTLAAAGVLDEGALAALSAALEKPQ
ncbi:MAG: TolC family protein [Elusimicrobia bacterium]|nr:TolC family protein [Elusimicrobiota bacterium]